MKVDGWYLLLQENLSFIFPSFSSAFLLCFPPIVQFAHPVKNNNKISTLVFWPMTWKDERLLGPLPVCESVWSYMSGRWIRKGRVLCLKNPYKERKKRSQWVLRFPPVACLPLLPVKTPREEAGYEFILRWDEVINARHLLSSASCQTRSSNTKRNAAPVGELQTSVRHMMQHLLLMNCLFFTEFCSIFSMAFHFLQKRSTRRHDRSRKVIQGSRDVVLVQRRLAFLRWQL